MFGYSWLRTSQNSDLVHALLDGCNAFGLEVEGFHTETGPGVYETAIRYDLLEAAADKCGLFKSAVKEICARHGLHRLLHVEAQRAAPGLLGARAPVALDPGRRAKHLPRSERRRRGLRKTLRHYLGGQLKLMPELTALYWPTINSYKRSVENTWAPTSATWGRENRTCALRVIGPDAKAMRVEFRLLGADMNPYVGMAASLAAGLWGIEHEVEPRRAGDRQRLPERRRAAAAQPPRRHHPPRPEHGRSRAPRRGVRGPLPPHPHWEVRQYERAVTTWELERYFELA